MGTLVAGPSGNTSFGPGPGVSLSLIKSQVEVVG